MPRTFEHVLPATAPLLVFIGVFSPAVSDQEAHAIGVEAGLCLYPLMTMDVTRKQSTNGEPGKDALTGKWNPPPVMKAVAIPALSTD